MWWRSAMPELEGESELNRADRPRALGGGDGREARAAQRNQAQTREDTPGTA